MMMRVPQKRDVRCVCRLGHSPGCALDTGALERPAEGCSSQRKKVLDVQLNCRRSARAGVPGDCDAASRGFRRVVGCRAE